VTICYIDRLVQGIVSFSAKIAILTFVGLWRVFNIIIFPEVGNRYFPDERLNV